MLVKSGAMLKKARDSGYAVCAFNIINMETVQAVISAAVAEKAPVILQTSEKAITYAGLDYLSSLMKVAAKSPVHVAIHLDHGKSLCTVKSCIKSGYTSVMIDGSMLPYKENIKLTKSVVAYARGRATVEAELGTIGDSGNYTDPNQAEDFVRRTKTDLLAVAIGTKHGLHKGKVSLRYSLLKEIGEKIHIPLVLHGSSHLKPGEIKKCMKLGIAKFNFDSDLRSAFMQALKKGSELTTRGRRVVMEDPREVLGIARLAAQKAAAEKIRLCSVRR
ncbi:MAG: class II fructose-bisphosphate aldolase [Candidatus Aenigmarchaeota archaeon]|nr:class II fructose-bisphosphate aldolase [Candidatus Aenigmarchaeota archaeon]